MNKRFLDFFKPKHYQLELGLDRSGRKFSGKVILIGEQLAGEFYLHADRLNITKITSKGQPIDFKHKDYQLTLRPQSKLTNQPIEIEFSGMITDQMNGIYPCYYKIDDRPYEMLATQFESHYARQAFPCIDEPAAKATFDLTLVTETGVTVLSNTPQTSQTEQNQRLTTKFETTPKMSPYVLAFVVGDLIKLSRKTRSDVEVNAYASAAYNPNDLKFALDVACNSMDWFEEYLGVPFPLPKCDHVALPDFSAGAMENWGLITYRQGYLLSNESTNQSLRQAIAKVIAHELAHMWFGNLVTMSWWDELWLNESLASLLENLALEARYPEIDTWSTFYSNNYSWLRNRDQSPGVQPIITPIEHPDQISTIFDGAIVYTKGAVIMEMLRRHLGDKLFRKSLRGFLKEFAYKTASTEDFLGYFDQISQQDVTNLIKPWLYQSGYPMLNIKAKNSQLAITQSQFGYDSDQTWPIPLFANQAELPKILDQPETTCNFDPSRPLILNHQIANCSITNYDPKLKTKLRQSIADGQVCRLDRLNFIESQALLAEQQIIPSHELIDDLISFANETELAVWQGMLTPIAKLRFFVKDRPSEAKFKQLIAQITRPQDAALKAKKKLNFNQKWLSRLLTDKLVYAEDQATLKQMNKLFQANKKCLDNLPANHRRSILTVQIRHYFSQSLFDNFLETYQTTNEVELKFDLEHALTAVQNQKAGEILIKQLTNPEVIKPQDMQIFFHYLMLNSTTKPLAWQWLTNNFENLRRQFSDNKDYVGFMTTASMAIRTQGEFDQFIDLFAPYQNDLAMERDFKVAKTEISRKIKLWRDQIEAVEQKLEDLKLD